MIPSDDSDLAAVASLLTKSNAIAVLSGPLPKLLTFHWANRENAGLLSSS